jgi:hypothetical protein
MAGLNSYLQMRIWICRRTSEGARAFRHMFSLSVLRACARVKALFVSCQSWSLGWAFVVVRLLIVYNDILVH